MRSITHCIARAYCVLFPVTTVGGMTVVAHTDGESVLTVGPDTFAGLALAAERRASLLLYDIFRLPDLLVFPVGMLVARKTRVLASPLPFLPPAQTLIHTPEQRLRLHRRRPGLYFMALSALFGTAAYQGAAIAFARATIFRQAPPDSALAATILTQAARFRFGARELTSIAQGPDPSQCRPVSIVSLTAQSLAVEQQLRQALLEFTNPAAPDEQDYIREWGQAVQTFDPTDIPPEWPLRGSLASLIRPASSVRVCGTAGSFSPRRSAVPERSANGGRMRRPIFVDWRRASSSSPVWPRPSH